jgi:2,3-dihydroxybiphenyl 1,2-dioxygenase
MTLMGLGYIGIGSRNTGDWDHFSTNILGMQKVDAGAKVRAYRMDDRKQRLIVTGESPEGLDFLGWETASAVELDALAGRLENVGVAVKHETSALADQRHVSQLISFHDPEGNRIEVFCGPAIASDPFRPGRLISGFKTGSLGMGHAVLHATDVDLLLSFYRDLLGFKVTDYGLTPYKLYFFHLNGRHHSFAMVGSGRRGLHHFMVELLSLDDVGQGYDLAQMEEGRLAYTLGRHSNDHMMSFYANSPSKFFVEYGWGATVIDPESWEPHETYDGPSYWGHERLYMPEGSPDRERLREMRMNAAKKGMRAPNPASNCAWLDSVIRQE